MMKLKNLDFAEITQRLESQMLLPKLTGQIIQSMLDEDINIPQLAAQISQEQAIVVRTLRVANSPFYGLSRQVDNLESAIIILGFRTIRNIAFGVSLTHAFKKTSAFDQHAFWQHAIAVGSAARHLARLKNQNTEMAFTAGLLHNIGKLALASVFPEEYKAVTAYQETHDVPLLAAEKTILGLDHTEIGAHLTKTWNLPPSLIDVVAFCHAPSLSGTEENADSTDTADSSFSKTENGTTDSLKVGDSFSKAKTAGDLADSFSKTENETADFKKAAADENADSFKVGDSFSKAKNGTSDSSFSKTAKADSSLRMDETADSSFSKTAKASLAAQADSARNPNITTDIIHIARAIAPALHLAEKDPKHTAIPPLDAGAWTRLSFNPETLTATFPAIINDYTDLSLALLE